MSNLALKVGVWPCPGSWAATKDHRYHLNILVEQQAKWVRHICRSREHRSVWPGQTPRASAGSDRQHDSAVRGQTETEALAGDSLPCPV